MKYDVSKKRTIPAQGAPAPVPVSAVPRGAISLGSFWTLITGALARISGIDRSWSRQELRALGSACLAHVLHDGYTDLLYLLFPIWQREFGLSFTLVGIMKTAFSGTLSLSQIPAARFSERFGERVILAAGTVLIGSAVLLYGFAYSAAALFVLLLLGGLGAGVQHPLASTVVARAFRNSRNALAVYNFAGDAGKVLLPSAAALLIALFGWRTALWPLAVAGIFLGFALFWLIPAEEMPKPEAGPSNTAALAGDVALRPGFRSLTAIGILDNATRTAFLTFMPLLLSQKGAAPAMIGTALSLIFAGGAAGKFACGMLAERLGATRTVVVTEVLTAACIASFLILPLDAVFLLLIPLGIALNGTSSVLYGTVAELAPESHRAHAYAVFYTASLGAGAIAPLLFGMVADRIDLAVTLFAVASMALFTVPLALLLAKRRSLPCTP